MAISSVASGDVVRVARGGQPSPSAKRHTVGCAIAGFHIVNPWSRANAMACVRDQTPSLSPKLP